MANSGLALSFLAHTDNLLDNRPALASLKGGELQVIGSSDSPIAVSFN